MEYSMMGHNILLIMELMEQTLRDFLQDNKGMAGEQYQN